MARAELVGVVLVVVGVMACALAAGLTLGVAAALAVVGVSLLAGGCLVVRAAIGNAAGEST